MLRKCVIAIIALASVSAGARAEVKADYEKSGLALKDLAESQTVPLPAAPAESAANDTAGAAKASKTAKWTIMVYINAKNDLEPFAFTNLRQMEKVGSTDKVNVVVEFGRMAKYSQADGGWKGCRRYLMRKGQAGTMLASPVVQDLGYCDMGDYKHAIDFGKWAMAKYPADHYMYVLWNHGSGWIYDKEAKSLAATRAISYDECPTLTCVPGGPTHSINIPQLAQVLQALGHVAIYGSDACLMQMPEVNYEIKSYADYIVGSQYTEAGSGWDYERFLNNVYASDMSPLAVANAETDSYTPQYSDGASQSTVNPGALDDFIGKLDKFSKAVMDSGEKQAARQARDSAQHDPNEPCRELCRNNKDLYDFTKRMVNSSANAEVKGKGQALMQYIDGTLVLNNKVTSDYGDSRGLAIYLPSSEYDGKYETLTFAKKAQWPVFIKWLLK